MAKNFNIPKKYIYRINLLLGALLRPCDSKRLKHLGFPKVDYFYERLIKRMAR